MIELYELRDFGNELILRGTYDQCQQKMLELTNQGFYLTEPDHVVALLILKYEISDAESNH